jgi:hypothetical protein
VQLALESTTNQNKQRANSTRNLLD